MILRLVAVASVLVLGGASAFAQTTLIPLGAPVQVHASTLGFQMSGRPVATGDGGFRVVWTSTRLEGVDEPQGFVLSRRFDAAARPVGSELRVDVEDDLPELDVDADAWGDGRFVVTWGRDSEDRDECSSCSALQGDVFGRIFDARGAPLGGVFQVDELDQGFQLYPEVAVLDEEAFVVTWTDLEEERIVARVYDAPGAPRTPFVVAEPQPPSLFVGATSAAVPAVDGGVRVVWNEVFCSYACGAEILDRRFTRDGVALGEAMSIAAPIAFLPDLKPLAAGGWVVAWTEELIRGPLDAPSVWMRTSDADGALSAAHLVAGPSEAIYPFEAAVATDETGHFVVAWRDLGPSARDADGTGITARLFDDAGTPLGLEVQVNSYETARQMQPELEHLGDGVFVATWTSRGSPTDDFGDSVQARLLGMAEILFRDGFESGAADRWSDSFPGTRSRR